MRPEKHGSFKYIMGESGFILEHMVFGGAINFYHNPDTITLPEAGFSKLVALVQGLCFETEANVHSRSVHLTSMMIRTSISSRKL